MTPKPSDLPARITMPPCPTPEKLRFRSAAAARRHHRASTSWAAAGVEKPHLRPYRCDAGDHWHLTSQTEEDGARIQGILKHRTPRREGGGS